MASQRYEISLRVLKNIYLLYKHQEKMRGQRGRLLVQPLGYVMSTKVIFRRAEVFRDVRMQANLGPMFERKYIFISLPRAPSFSQRPEPPSLSPYFLLINTDEILNHFTKGVESRVFICSHSNSDLSRVKISCFRAKAHLVFHWCLHNKYVYYMTSLVSGQDELNPAL